MLLAAVWGRPLGLLLVLLTAGGVVTAVALGVHHAEVVAHRVGGPFGTLVLALAVAVIELGLIGSIMAFGGAGRARWPATPCSPR